MKFSSQKSFTFALLLLAIASAPGAFAQAPPTKEASTVKTEAISTPEKRPAKVLFEEARAYADKQFVEFNKQKIPFDQKLEAKTKQEQKDLAAKYAATLQARESLADADVYYLGMLHHLAGNADGALDAMRNYLAGETAGENPQVARAV